jgi:hypothetical protein
MHRLAYNDRRKVVKSILEREENSSRQQAEPKLVVGRPVPEIRLDSCGERSSAEVACAHMHCISLQEETWAWEEGEEMEYEFCEQEEGAVSN